MERNFRISFSELSQGEILTAEDAFSKRTSHLFLQNLNQPTIYVGVVNSGTHQLMPDKKNRDMWWAFLSGKPESEWRPETTKDRSRKHQKSDQGTLSWTEADNIADDNAPDESNILPDNEGEIEHVPSMNAADTLPSSDGIPSPLPLEYLEGLSQPSSGVHKSGNPFALHLYEERFAPREPTTELLKLIDEVNLTLSLLHISC